MKLSILIPTLVDRAADCAALVRELETQIAGIPGAKDEVEIRVMSDNRERTVGEKRNALLHAAAGDFVAFVDDDDQVADDYVRQILEAIIRNPTIDCVGMRGIMTRKNSHQRQVVYSLNYPGGFESGGVYYRPPCHLTPVRRSIAIRYSYANVSLGEDAQWSTRVAADRVLKSEFFVDRILYHYRFNPKSSGTQKNYNVPVPNPSTADRFKVVILSANPKNLAECIDSIFAHEPAFTADRIVVVDDGASRGWQGRIGIVWVPGLKPFNFARNANIGIVTAQADVVLLNDDARLESRFGFSSLAYAVHGMGDIGVCSAAVRGAAGGRGQAPKTKLAAIRYVKNVAFVAAYLTKDTVAKIGKLDEQFVGYGFEDNDYCLRAEKAGIPVGVYDGCTVGHDRPEISSFRTRPNFTELMTANRAIFERKWGNEILEEVTAPPAAPALPPLIDTDANFKSAWELFAKEEWEAAIPFFVAASRAAQDPIDRSECMLRIARCQSNLNRLSVALNWFAGAADEAPERREIHFYKAVAFIRSRKMEEAIRAIDECLAIPLEKRSFSVYDMGTIWDGSLPKEARQFAESQLTQAKAKFYEGSHGS